MVVEAKMVAHEAENNHHIDFMSLSVDRDRSVHRYNICGRSSDLVTSTDHNDGTHLTGVISDDALWQTRWRRISNHTPRFYDAPKGKAGRHFVTILTEEL